MILTEDQADRISADGLIHDAQRLKELQALPLYRKVGITTARIIEWYQHFNGNVYVSFSGGKDSTVLLHLVRSIFPDVPAVFSNTGLEYPELQKFVKSFDNVTTIYPRMKFTDVIGTYGYPLIGKEVSEAIYYARRITPPSDRRRRGLPDGDSKCLASERIQRSSCQTTRIPWDKSQELEQSRLHTHTHTHTHTQDGQSPQSPQPWKNWRRRCLLGVAAKEESYEDFSGKSLFNKEKWLPIAEDLPVPISMYCCNVMKKQPMQKYSRANKAYPILGTMAEESRIRKQAWIRQGCNAFTGKIHSQPMSFWTEQDVLQYIKQFNLEICSVYGDINIVDKKGNIVETEEACMPEGCKWQCSKCQRSGCIYCLYGMHSEKGKTRLQLLAETHPRQYEYCIGGGQWVDNPAYDPTASMEPDELGWRNWNPKKIWVPSKEGLGLGEVMRMCNEIMGYEMYRWE